MENSNQINGFNDSVVLRVFGDIYNRDPASCIVGFLDFEELPKLLRVAKQWKQVLQPFVQQRAKAFLTKHFSWKIETIPEERLKEIVIPLALKNYYVRENILNKNFETKTVFHGCINIKPKTFPDDRLMTCYERVVQNDTFLIRYIRLGKKARYQVYDLSNHQMVIETSVPLQQDGLFKWSDAESGRSFDEENGNLLIYDYSRKLEATIPLSNDHVINLTVSGDHLCVDLVHKKMIVDIKKQKTVDLPIKGYQILTWTYSEDYQRVYLVDNQRQQRVVVLKKPKLSGEPWQKDQTIDFEILIEALEIKGSVLICSTTDAVNNYFSLLGNDGNPIQNRKYGPFRCYCRNGKKMYTISRDSSTLESWEVGEGELTKKKIEGVRIDTSNSLPFQLVRITDTIYAIFENQTKHYTIKFFDIQEAFKNGCVTSLCEISMKDTFKMNFLRWWNGYQFICYDNGDDGKGRITVTNFGDDNLTYSREKTLPAGLEKWKIFESIVKIGVKVFMCTGVILLTIVVVFKIFQNIIYSQTMRKIALLKP